MDRLLAILGIAIGLVGTFIPQAWPDLPASVSWAGILIGVFLIGFAFGLWLGERRAVDTPKPIWTSLRLQFYGDHRIPTEIVKQNVESWYSLWTESRRIEFKDKDGRVIQDISIPKQWTIFVQFEKPTSYKEVIVNFGLPDPPMYEIKTANKRYLILFVSADIPPTKLEVYTRID